MPNLDFNSLRFFVVKFLKLLFFFILFILKKANVYIIAQIIMIIIKKRHILRDYNVLIYI